MGSSTTQGSVYKHRQKLRIEEKVFCPHSCTAMVGSSQPHSTPSESYYYYCSSVMLRGPPEGHTA